MSLIILFIIFSFIMAIREIAYNNGKKEIWDKFCRNNFIEKDELKIFKLAINENVNEQYKRIKEIKEELYHFKKDLNNE